MFTMTTYLLKFTLKLKKKTIMRNMFLKCKLTLMTDFSRPLKNVWIIRDYRENVLESL